MIVTTDDLDRYDDDQFPEGVDVWDRTRLDEAQKVLAAIPGTTVLIHDQACAAEKRRARSRGKLATPDFRVVINERVCEGCGDCGDKSNCLSVQPVDTPFGRKTRIDQTSCNFDFSCMRGRLPVVRHGVDTDAGRPEAARGTSTGDVDVSDLPEPTPIVDPTRFTVRLSGIGGTGVVTVSQILGTAAMLDGLDGARPRPDRPVAEGRTGHERHPHHRRARPSSSNHASASGVDCVLAFDLLAAASDSHRRGATPDRTVVIANTHVVPTGEMVTHPDHRLPGVRLAARAARRGVAARAQPLLRRRRDHATGCSAARPTANIFMLGVAVQVGRAAGRPAKFLERAIELNGVAVERNIAAFRWGRRLAVDPDARRDGRRARRSAAGDARRADRTPRRRPRRLPGTSATPSASAPRSIASAPPSRPSIPARPALTDAVARNLHKLMAYKDEYEVARLLLLDESRDRYEAIGGKRTKVTYHLHPPMLRAMGMKNKLKLRRSGAPLMKALRSDEAAAGHDARPVPVGRGALPSSGP